MSPQHSFFDPEFVDPKCLVEGTVPWLLARSSTTLFPSWLFEGWEKPGRGRNPWSPRVLMALLILRFHEEGMSRAAACRRAARDSEWRAALGLAFGERTPDESSVRRFEKFMTRRHPVAGIERFVVVHEHFVRLCIKHGVVRDPTYAMDSTPMWAYGAVLDTVRLLGDGVRSLVKMWARLTDVPVEKLASEWRVRWVTAKSTKGAFGIDWKDSKARSEVITELAEGATAVVAGIVKSIHKAPAKMHKTLRRRGSDLMKVIAQDLEADDDGNLVVARRVAKDRLVSLTDPQSRHFRKTKSKRFTGFKLHLLGDVVSGLITSVSVTSGNVHDSAVAHRLLRRAQRVCDDVDRVFGDTAYGGATLRHDVKRQFHVEVVAPPPPANGKSGDGFTRADFSIDFECNVATCPAGVASSSSTTRFHSTYGGQVPVVKWTQQECDVCPLREKCLPKNHRSKRLVLHPHEEELRLARRQWSDESFRASYRRRSECERLINQVVRHGARHARAWGLQAANTQGLLVVMRCNLGLLAKALG